MRIEEYKDGPLEARVLLGMVHNATVLGHLAAHWSGNFFASPVINLLGTLLVEHYRRHRTAPGRGIISLLEAHADREDRHHTEEAGRLLAHVLDGNGESQEAPALLIDLATTLCKRAALSRLAESIQLDLAAGEADRAIQRATETISRLSRAGGTRSGVDLFNDPEAVARVFQREKADVLVQYPGALGRFFGESLSRDNLVFFLAPEGSGKSFWLLDVGWRAMKQRCRVAHFDCGDMSEEQVNERYLVRAAAHPSVSDDGRWPTTVRNPSSLEVQNGEPLVAYDDLVYSGPLDREKAWAACEKVRRRYFRSDRSFFRDAFFPSGTASVNDLRSALSGWALDGFIPDVVLVDYADLLAPRNRRDDKLEQTNQTWMELRQMAQELHCLVATVTQANRESYRAKTVRREHTGGDKRKLAHAAYAWALSATEEEEKNQLSRIGWLKRRRGGKAGLMYVHVAACLPLAQPSTLSCLPERKGQEPSEKMKD